MTPKELLEKGAKELGLDLSPERQSVLFQHIAELRKWNSKINLTAITDEREIVIKHVLDSLTYLRYIPLAANINVLDIGSGAGYPSIPMNIAHSDGLTIVMVESSKKKASFLRHIIRHLHLKNITVLDHRVEELPKTYQASQDVVTARAFADIGKVVSAGLPFLKPGGFFILSRGPEESMSDAVLTSSGVEIVKKDELTLPHSDYRRVIWVLRKKAAV